MYLCTLPISLLMPASGANKREVQKEPHALPHFASGTSGSKLSGVHSDLSNLTYLNELFHSSVPRCDLLELATAANEIEDGYTAC